MEVGIKVWVADDAVAWRRGMVLEKVAGSDGSARELRVRLEPAATANPSGARDEWDSDSDEAPGGQSAHEHEERVTRSKSCMWESPHFLFPLVRKARRISKNYFQHSCVLSRGTDLWCCTKNILAFGSELSLHCGVHL